MRWPTAISSASHRLRSFPDCMKTRSGSDRCKIIRFCFAYADSIWVLAVLGFISCAALPAPTEGAECLSPTKQSQLETVLACSNAMCCSRELDRQVNLVRAIASKLKTLGYTISDPSALPEESPDLSGMYYPTLRLAVGQYKQDHHITDGNTDITYELVATLLDVDLFERWK
jgi:hypothetical protein